ncbi:unnamed protein product [Durusdinium trenchii]|uniref:Uncharacterized protein n=1 Tax=Durusdinium trenchii TaxID=1381693 RepID=A0ABP0SWY5_9DINO
MPQPDSEQAHGAPAAPLDEASAVATKAIEAAIEVLRKEEETTAVARTIDWLRSTSNAVKNLLSECRAESGYDEDATGVASIAAVRMQEQWLEVLRAREAVIEKELEEFEESEYRCSRMSFELQRRSKEIEQMEETLKLENSRAKAVRKAQAILVPRVAKVVEEMRKPLPPPGCKDGWPWEVSLDLWSSPSTGNAGAEGVARGKKPMSKAGKVLSRSKKLWSRLNFEERKV